MNSQNALNWTQMYERHMDIWTSLVLGNQWWDEWKWKIVDILTQESDGVIRFQWWHNAWHTVKANGEEFDLHILPSWVVSEWKINLITSWCVLGIDLYKINLDKIIINKFWLHCDSKFEKLIKRKNWEQVRVWLIPEIEKLKSKWINFKKSWLKISWETIVIWMHNVILDWFDEKSREYAWLAPIWSTWSWISRAYSSETQRFHFTLNDLLKRPDAYYDSIKALWAWYYHNFPLITEYDLIEHAKKERQAIIEMLNKKEVEIIDNEKEYIDNLLNDWKKLVWEWAQAAMIWSWNSYFWTASNPSFEEFSRVTGLSAEQVWNIFLVHKMPQSSVWYRPQFLKFSSTPEVENFIDEYWEIWVSTWRRRDLFQFSATETARWAYLNTKWIWDESKIVPVFNRIDWLKDTLKFYPDWIFKIVTWYSYEVLDILSWEKIKVNVWNTNNWDTITPKSLLKNYPSKSEQLDLFSVKPDDLITLDVVKQVWDIQLQINNLIWLHLWAIFNEWNDNDIDREFIGWYWPWREQIECKKMAPIRKI